MRRCGMTTERLDLVSTASGTSVSRGDDELLVAVDEPSVEVRRSGYRRLQDHRRTWMAIRGFREIVLIAAVYAFTTSPASRRGQTTPRAARPRPAALRAALGIAPEHALNKLFSAHIALGLPADYIYATLHYIVTPAVLIWLWRRYARRTRHARTV